MIRKRLYKLGFAVALLLTCLTVGNALTPREQAITGKMLGHDFLAFYTAGHFVNTGQLHNLYDLDAVKQYQAELMRSAALEVDKGFGPWWNPPFAALAFAPLAKLPYPSALATWMTLSSAALVLSLIALVKLLGSNDWRTWLLLPLFLITSMPFFQAVSHGQNTFFTLGLLLAVVMSWRADKPLLAGLLAGLLFYKPQHAAIVSAVLCLSMGRRAVLGLAITGCSLLAINLLLLPGTLADFLLRMPANLKAFQEAQPYYWERHATFKAFWRLLLQGHSLGETRPMVKALWFASMLPIAVGLLTAWWRGTSRDRLIAATIAAAPLLMPFGFDYDLLLLCIPATLWARELIAARPTRLPIVDRIALLGWIGLYLWTFLNPGLAAMTRVSLTVPLLAMIAGSLIYKALQPSEAAEEAAEASNPWTPTAAIPA